MVLNQSPRPIPRVKRLTSFVNRNTGVVGHDPKCSMGGPTDQSRHSIFYKSFLRECPRVVIDILLQAFPQDVMHFLPSE